MSEMEYYITKLKENISRDNGKGAVADRGVEDLFQDLLISISDSYLEAYERNNLEKMKQLLEEQRKLRKQLTKELNKSANQILIISAQIVDQYNTFNKIYQNLIADKNIKVDAEFIEVQYKNARSIMEFLYRHSHVRHKDLIELGISRSSVTDTLRSLENAGLVDRIQCDNCAFYNLSSEGRKYIRSKVENIDREITIDAELVTERTHKVTALKAQRVCYQYTSYDNSRYLYAIYFNEKYKEEREKLQRKFTGSM